MQNFILLSQFLIPNAKMRLMGGKGGHGILGGRPHHPPENWGGGVPLPEKIRSARRESRDLVEPFNLDFLNRLKIVFPAAPLIHLK